MVADFRSRDIAAGGQGAPLVSAVDVLWLRGRPGTPVALNLGGIANLTSSRPAPLAFDTGPANALLDAPFPSARGGGSTSTSTGPWPRAARVHGRLLRRLLAEPYYALPAPKTTGKELFHREYLDAALAGLPAVADDDLVATLTALTARTVADAVRFVRWHRGDRLRRRHPQPHADGDARAPSCPASRCAARTSWACPAAAKEAYAFAVLGFCTVHGLPGTDRRAAPAPGIPSVLGAVLPGRAGFPWRPRPERLPRVLEIAQAAA